MPTEIVYFGSGAFGLPTLERLVREHRVVAIVTQPDKPAGRGGKLSPTPVAAWAGEHAPEIPILKPAKCNAPDVVAQIRGTGATTYVVIAFGQKIGRALLEERFAINLHASVLPRWRGAAPINAAIMAGDASTGNSVITLAETMDAGQVLGVTHRRIEPTVTAGELHDILAQDGPSAVFRVLREKADGSLMPEDQDESKVTLAPKLSRADGVLDFSKHAGLARCRINGLSPWPGVTVMLAGQQVKLLRAGPVLTAPAAGEAGSLVDVGQGHVLCAEHTAFAILEVQPAGKRAMTWSDFVRGNPLPTGTRVSMMPTEHAPPGTSGGGETGQ